LDGEQFERGVDGRLGDCQVAVILSYRRGQADIVLVFPRGLDHARRGVDQAGKHEALDVRHGVEQRSGLIGNHRCFLPRGGQAWGTQPS
jgi:hypothetical protein